MAKEKTTKKKEKHPGGRPSPYNDKFHPQLAYYMARAGMIDKQIADAMSISVATLNNWKNEYPEFLESLKKGKDTPDDQVESALLRRALGFDNKQAVKIFMPANAKAPVYAPYTEQVHPDVTACIFWLKNRRPDRWRDKQDIQFTGEDNGPVKFEIVEPKRANTKGD